MRITTGNVFLGFGLVLLLMNGENIKSGIQKGDQIKAERSAHNDKIKQHKQEFREAIDLSKVALDRAKSCISVVDSEKKVPSYLTEGQKVIDTSVKRPVRPKAVVCSALGDTGIIDSTGGITDLARVTDTDMATYKSILKIK